MPLDAFQPWCQLSNVAQNVPFVVVSSGGALAHGANVQTLSITIMDAPKFWPSQTSLLKQMSSTKSFKHKDIWFRQNWLQTHLHIFQKLVNTQSGIVKYKRNLPNDFRRQPKNSV
ncbi:hypothetical protein Zmor_018095 [Zophobas morio]|uniref:Uncharacterized protein n=1 Tax=Zophobas morio TaxID=2755281 RepID=A0AA38IBI1_9CUCU|nr:hypothetical protein Zmor_018095 [Zophobas morio]